MGRRRRKRKLPEELVEAQIESLSHDGRGVAHVDGKVTFIYGALPGEQVKFQYTAQRKDHDEGDAKEILSASESRVVPGCSGFGLCGGCSLQHMSSAAQILGKQQSLIDSLQRIGKVNPQEILTPLQGASSWGYRRKARLGVKHVRKKGKVLVGFRERSAGYVAELEECLVLHPKVGLLLTDISELIAKLSLHERIPQIEVAMDDQQCILIFRVLDEPTDSDVTQLARFASDNDLFIYLQPGGPDTVRPLTESVDLHYSLPEFDLDMAFLPTDFTQVNTDINRQMVGRAVALLAPDETDRVLDLFCGIGNFTLPLARGGAQVTGVEGSSELVARARVNAENNALPNTRFYTANLYDELDNEPWMQEQYNKVLLDPPRSGAVEILAHFPRLGVEKIVYVSCYPGTLARDADILVNQLGYTLVSAGVMDMFPHTSHVESMAVFERH